MFLKFIVVWREVVLTVKEAVLSEQVYLELDSVREIVDVAQEKEWTHLNAPKSLQMWHPLSQPDVKRALDSIVEQLVKMAFMEDAVKVGKNLRLFFCHILYRIS